MSTRRSVLVERSADTALYQEVAARLRLQQATRARYDDPARFVDAVLGHDIWTMQAQILRSVRDNRRTAVKACHSSGKTYVASEAVLWWLHQYEDAIVVTTAPTWTQVERLLWGEIHKALAGSSMRVPIVNQTELMYGPGHYAIGLSTNEGVKFQGFHGAHVLIVLDEAPGVRGDIWEAIEGISAGGRVHLLALGNPTLASGPFYDAFTRDASLWNCFTIDAFDTPNLHGLTLPELLTLPDADLDGNERPYLVTRRWVHDRYRSWGESSPLWQARVRGQFPAQDPNALYPLSDLERARVPVEDDGGPVVCGIDVAGPGKDETALCVRTGNAILHQQAWGATDARGPVVAALRPWLSRIAAVNVDAIGMGHYFVQHLRDLELPVTAVNVGEAARDGRQFRDRKAEVYWAFREYIQAGIIGLLDEEAFSQLATMRYEIDGRGRITIEDKDTLRKRIGGRSPDRAEAVILAFIEPARSHFSGQPSMVRPRAFVPSGAARQFRAWGGVR